MWKEIADNYEVERDKLSLPAILIDKIIVDLAMEDQLGPVLDFGAGSGTLARLLASRGRQVTAYEPNAPMREVLIRQTPAELSKHIRVVDNLDELPMESHFETILCVNVVDHLLDVHSTFRMFRSRVAPAGKLVLCIPHPMKNIGAWVKEGKKDAWDYVYYRLNDYMNEGVVKRDREDVHGNLIIKDVVSQHRKISTYYNWVVDSGFVVEKMFEPGPDFECQEAFPAYYKQSSRIPYFWILLCRPSEK